MKRHWREWFGEANNVCWQAVEIPESRRDEWIKRESIASTEAMYQAFKARLLEEMGNENESKDERSE